MKYRDREQRIIQHQCCLGWFWGEEGDNRHQCLDRSRHSVLRRYPIVPRDRGVNFGSGSELLGVTIEDEVWIAGNMSILEGVKIGRGAIVGAGAVVTKDVEPYAIVVGVPARVLRYRD